MRKVFLLLIVSLLLCGCTAVQDESLENIIKNATESNLKLFNKYRKGYKYNLPEGLSVLSNFDYNEILSGGEYTYYLYIDGVSYYNKVIENYNVNQDSYISLPINFEEKYGYLEINELKSGKYFIEIMYNYAKIEVIVKKSDIHVSVSNAIMLLSSIEFNDNILKTLLDEETAQFKEFEFNIFETATTKSDYLQVIEADIYKEKEGVHDSDLIRGEE